MESVYAALLLHKAKTEINEANLEKVLTAAGVKPEKNQLKTIVAGLEGKNIDDLIAGAAAAAPVVSLSAPAGKETKEGKPKKKKKAKEKEEKKEEEPTGIGALFG
ncbi:MAG: 50S ribosomal protein P1 [Promethearchaeota archaeon]